MDFQEIATKLTPKTISYTQLLLDPFNPRFEGEKDYPVNKGANPASNVTQSRIMDFLKKKGSRYDIKELKESIASVGFLKMDRIVVKPVDTKKDLYIVIEGNRRVAAIKWLMEDVESHNYKISDVVKASIAKMDVLVLDTTGQDDDFASNATWFLQGLRHITGVKAWGPYQQAELIHKFISQGKNFNEAGKTIGLGSITASRMLKAYYALNNMNEDAEFKDFYKPDLFSHFQQAYTKTSVRDWLKWDENSNKFSDENNLHRFYELICGIDDAGNVNPDMAIKAMDVREKLPLVVEIDASRAALMQGKTLEFCYAIATSEAYSAPTWHSAVKNAISKLNTISWTYEYTDSDIALLDDLAAILSKLKGAIENGSVPKESAPKPKKKLVSKK